jgi:peroxiredoxin
MTAATWAARAIGLIAALAQFSIAARAAELRPWNDGAAPAFALPGVRGGDVALDTYRGRIVLVHFFATWCEPCREELPALQRLVTRAGPDSIVVLAISVAEVEQPVRRLLATMPITFPVLLDLDRAVAKAWNIATLPSTVVLDANLEPRLVVEADLAWDRVEPKALIDMTLIKMLGIAEPLNRIKPSPREANP